MPVEPTETRVSAPDRDDWEHHWHDCAESAAVNPAQAFRRQLIVRLLALSDDPVRFVDIGSGTGELLATVHASAPHAELLGLELSRAGVERSRRRVPDAIFLQRDLTVDESSPSEYRDWASYAACSEVLEHVDDPQRVLVNAREYLAPGCRFIVTVPGGPMTAYDRYIGHRRHYRPADLAQLLRGSGFEHVQATGVGFPIFNLYRLFLRSLGSRLIDVAGAGTPSGAARAAMSGFAFLLARNTGLSSRGWQIVALAREPGQPLRPHG